MKRLCYALMIALIISFFPSLSQSAEIKFKGYMFGEFYYVASHNSGGIDDGGIEGRNGFWFRRIYFTSDLKLNDSWSGRLRFEMNSPGKLPFDSSGKLEPVVKDAYLRYKYSGQSFMFGIISTPTWGHNLEDFWGYRSLEKTPLDLYKLGSSRDFGFGIKGAFDDAKTVNYFVMFGNGASNKGETDKHKKFYGSLAIKPAEGVLIEAYADYEEKAGDNKYYVLQGFGGYEDSWGRIGVQWARRHYDTGDSDYDYDVFSGFAVIKAAKNVDVIGRFDHMRNDGFESSFKGDGISYLPFARNPGAPFNLIIGAISYSPVKNVWFIPNIKYVFYGDPDEGEKPSEDIYANLTVWFKF